jgi:hypothetical protein
MTRYSITRYPSPKTPLLVIATRYPITRHPSPVTQLPVTQSPNYQSPNLANTPYTDPSPVTRGSFIRHSFTATRYPIMCYPDASPNIQVVKAKLALTT